MKYKISISAGSIDDCLSPTPHDKTQQDLAAEIARTKQVLLVVSFHTKTTLRVDVGCEDIFFQCSYIPSGCEGLKFQPKLNVNKWTGDTYQANYFRLTKRQRLPQLIRYGAALVDSLHPGTVDTVTLQFLFDIAVAERINLDDKINEYYYTNSM